MSMEKKYNKSLYAVCRGCPKPTISVSGYCRECREKLGIKPRMVTKHKRVK